METDVRDTITKGHKNYTSYKYCITVIDDRELLRFYDFKAKISVPTIIIYYYDDMSNNFHLLQSVAFWSAFQYESLYYGNITNT